MIIIDKLEVQCVCGKSLVFSRTGLDSKKSNKFYLHCDQCNKVIPFEFYPIITKNKFKKYVEEKIKEERIKNGGY